MPNKNNKEKRQTRKDKKEEKKDEKKEGKPQVYHLMGPNEVTLTMYPTASELSNREFVAILLLGSFLMYPPPTRNVNNNYYTKTPKSFNNNKSN